MRVGELWKRPASFHVAYPPYDDLSAYSGIFQSTAPGGPAGEVIIWCPQARPVQPDLSFITKRPRGVPLIILLPRPDKIDGIRNILFSLPSFKPSAVLPYNDLSLKSAVHVAIESSVAEGLGTVVTRYITNRGIILDERLTKDVTRLFDIAPEIGSVSQLARRLFASRRTLGRRFSVAGLPVPSHVLQFARLLHAALRIQNEPQTIFKIAVALGYPDGFSMSNQMKRLIGCRPSELRGRLGWEWLVERWLKREGM